MLENCTKAYTTTVDCILLLQSSWVFISCVMWWWSLILVTNIWSTFSCSGLKAGSTANCTDNEIQSFCLKYKQLHPHFHCPILFFSLHS